MTDDDDDFSDLDDLLDEEDDEFADLDEYAEPEVTVKAIDLTRPTCWTCGDGNQIDGGTGARCHKCRKKVGWEDIEAEKEEKARLLAERKAEKSKTPRPIISGHCNTPTTTNPFMSHERCERQGAGSTANPEKRFHPCPCTCHLAHDEQGNVLVYTCDGCGGLLAEAPVYGMDEDGDPIYVHVDKRTHRMIYTGPCR